MIGYNSRLQALALVLLSCATAVSAETVDSGGFQYAVEPAPPWVEQYAVPPLADLGAEQPGPGLLLHDRQVRLDGAGAEEFTRVVAVVRDLSSVAAVSDFSIDFSPDYETLHLHSIEIVRDGRRLNRLSEGSIRLVQREQEWDSRIYNGVVSAMVTLPDVRVGDRLEYSYTISGRNPVFGERYFGGFSLAWSWPAGMASVRIVSDRQLQYRAWNSSLKPQISRHGQSLEYLWQARRIPPVLDEGEYPIGLLPFPWLQVTEYRSWAEVEAWARELYAEVGLDRDIRRQIDAWRDQYRDPEQILRAAVRFVQDEVRYVGVELGENSHRPSRPAATFERRYGDCKDKAVLLIAILRELGYDAFPALVSHSLRGHVADYLPSPGLFDHVIVAADVDGQRYWIDATVNHQRGRLERRGFTRFGHSLVIGDGSRDLVAVAPAPGYRQRIEVEEHYRTESFEAPSVLEVRSEYTGALADYYRGQFASRPAHEISRHYLAFYQRLYPGTTVLAPLRTEDDPDENRFVIYERYRVPEIWTLKDNTRIADFAASTIRDSLPGQALETRDAPLALSYPRQISHTVILSPPPGTVEDFNAAHFESNSEHMRYEAWARVKGDDIVAGFQFQTLADEVPPTRLKDYNHQLDQILGHISYGPTLLAEPRPQTGNNSRRRLLERLEDID